MDDLKLIAATKNQSDQMLKIVEDFSMDIRVQFGLNKCKLVVHNAASTIANFRIIRDTSSVNLERFEFLPTIMVMPTK